jgi:general secretion pathway protein G
MNQAMRSRHAGQRGFTLIELLVVIAVLAVLAAVVVFNVTGVKDKGSAAACSTDTKSVQSAYDAYLNDKGVAQAGPAFDATVLVPAYLHTAPTSCAKGFTIDAAGTIAGS